VPVKFVFKDRKSSQAAAEILREHLGLNSSTPYHKSLRAAINYAINQVKTQNPGYQAKVNLDLNGKTLKCFIRPDTKPPGTWVPYGSNIPLPKCALDTSLRKAPEMDFQVSGQVGQSWQRQEKTRAEDTRVSRTPVHHRDNQREDDTGMDMETETAAGTSNTEKPAATVTKTNISNSQTKIVDCSLKQTIPGLHTPPKGKTQRTTSRTSLPVQHSPPPKSKNLESSFGS
jgi:hypothetical protein